MASRLNDDPESGLLIKYDAGSISQRLREKSRELWPRRRTLVSAYSFRHFLAKSLKESGASRELIAKTLGHAADFAQCAYGRASRDKKSADQHGIFNAITSNPIRHSQKSDRLDRLLSARQGWPKKGF